MKKNSKLKKTEVKVPATENATTSGTTKVPSTNIDKIKSKPRIKEVKSTLDSPAPGSKSTTSVKSGMGKEKPEMKRPITVKSMISKKESNSWSSLEVSGSATKSGPMIVDSRSKSSEFIDNLMKDPKYSIPKKVPRGKTGLKSDPVIRSTLDSPAPVRSLGQEVPKEPEGSQTDIENSLEFLENLCKNPKYNKEESIPIVKSETQTKGKQDNKLPVKSIIENKSSEFLSILLNDPKYQRDKSVQEKTRKQNK